MGKVKVHEIISIPMVCFVVCVVWFLVFSLHVVFSFWLGWLERRGGRWWG